MNPVAPGEEGDHGNHQLNKSDGMEEEPRVCASDSLGYTSTSICCQSTHPSATIE